MWFPLARKSFSTSQNEVRLKTTFPLDKEKLSLTVKSEK